MPPEGGQFFASGRLPDFRRGVVAAGNNTLAVRRDGHTPNFAEVPTESLEFLVRLSLPVIPFKPALRIGSCLLEQLPHSFDVALTPGLLRQIHIRGVEMPLRQQ